MGRRQQPSTEPPEPVRREATRGHKEPRQDWPGPVEMRAMVPQAQVGLLGEVLGGRPVVRPGEGEPEHVGPMLVVGALVRDLGRFGDRHLGSHTLYTEQKRETHGQDRTTSYAGIVHQRLSRPLRNSDGPLLLESFLVAAVVSFLGIRWFLTLTGFPKVGGGELHIAHMLWGGTLMLAALILLLAYLDRPIQYLAAIVAGLGFGTFVDEIGKFVTADNDYFFRPAVALIYVIFVAVFLVARGIEGRRPLTEREALANALDLLEGTLGEPLEREDRARIDELLDQVGTAWDLAPALRLYLDHVPSRPDEEAWWEAIPRWGARHYAQLAADPRFERVVTAAVIVYTAAAVIGSMLVVTTAQRPDLSQPLTVAALGQVISTLAGAALVARGVLALPSSRAEAYRWFVRGVLVWLLITQVFIFYESQLAGLSGLALDLGAYAALLYALRRETAPGKQGTA